MRKNSIRAGSFWKLYPRLLRGESEGLGVVTCAELGSGIDCFLRPARPQVIFQNGGGSCFDLLYRPHPSLKDLLIVHHDGCAFHAAGNPGLSLAQEWRALQSYSAADDQHSMDVYLWLLDQKGNLRVMDVESGWLHSPIELSGGRTWPSRL
ncbi:MAG: hypothetical protein U0931_27420 [Vulcanimicrobiota bacterium]